MAAASALVMTEDVPLSEINGERSLSDSRVLARKVLRGRAPKKGPDIAAQISEANVESRAAVQSGLNSDADEPASHLWIVLSYFAVAFSSQLLLLIPQVAVFRLPLRIAPFALSLMLAVVPIGRNSGARRFHPAMPMAAIILCIISFGLLNQYTDSVIAGLAQIALTAAIMSPLLWVGRLKLGVRGFATILLCLWGFNALSAGVGVLQIMFPGHFQGATSIVTQQNEEAHDLSYSIELADGTITERPYGLTDQPGGAAAGGLTAFVFGLGLLVSSKNIGMRSIYLLGMGLGLFIMYLSQVRSSLVMCLVAVISFAAIMAMRGEFARLTGSLLALAVVAVISTSAALVIGGSQTRDRMFTLVETNAGEVYQSNRGYFLDYTFGWVLPTYPVGAGLGRYGMMARYFGGGDSAANSLWAEIQWTAWAYDGGWPMVAAYPVALLIALWVAFQIGLNPKYGAVSLWAALLTAYGISVLAMIFDYPFFNSQGGLEFWLLNAALFSVAQTHLLAGKVHVPQGFEVLPAPWRPRTSPDAPGLADEVVSPVRRRPLGQHQRPAVIPIFDDSKPSQEAS